MGRLAGSGQNLAAPDRFVTLAGPKYDEGQATHGGLLTHRDCLAEMEQELIDLWHYHQAQKLKDLKLAIAHTPEEIRDISLDRWIHLRRGGVEDGNDLTENLIMKLWQVLQQRISGAEIHRV
jgi:hypothetical protein